MMIKTISAFTVMIIVTSSTIALANETKTPTNKKECLSLVIQAGKNVDKAQVDFPTKVKLMPKGQTMNLFCSAGRFSDAFSMYQEIMSLIAQVKK